MVASNRFLEKKKQETLCTEGKFYFYLDMAEVVSHTEGVGEIAGARVVGIAEEVAKEVAEEVAGVQEVAKEGERARDGVATHTTIKTKSLKQKQKPWIQSILHLLAGLIALLGMFFSGYYFRTLSNQTDLIGLGNKETSQILTNTKEHSILRTKGGQEHSFFPVNSGICVFISDAASGVGREAALQLADRGVHVLAGKLIFLLLYYYISIMLLL